MVSIPDFVGAMWSADSASKALGMTLQHVAPGQARVDMLVRDDMVNGHGLCHGGLIASLADSAFAVACNSRGVKTVSAGFSIDLLHAARLGDLLLATGEERTLRGRSGIYDVTVCVGDTVIAEFRGRSRAIR